MKGTKVIRTYWKPVALFLLFLIADGFSAASAENRVYSVVSDLNIRQNPGINSPVMGRMPGAQWVRAEKGNAEWTKVYVPPDINGYVHNQYITSKWIKTHKKERKIFLMSDHDIKKTWDIALGTNPVDDKIQQGDGATPVGRFFICEMLPDPTPKARYGARSLRISYPNPEDARRGLKDQLISKTEYKKIIRQNHALTMPLQNTTLGGSIRIHGGGAGNNWTLGCIAMHDRDIRELYENLPSKNTLVEIYAGKEQDQAVNQEGFLNRRILTSAKQLLKKDCAYTKEATAIIKIGFPMGDFDPKIGVCTDVVIRALRKTGVDLQALLYEDILLNKQRYPNIATPNPHIDHRRTRNLKIWLDHHAASMPDTAKKDWQAGDIVLMDTGITNGTVYDHIGIVSDTKTGSRPLVINLWTIGYRINEMDLLNGNYPAVVGHFRLDHPFRYHAVP